MGFDITIPKITATNEAGKIAQIQSYLFQLSDQLRYALNALETSSSSGGSANVAFNTASNSTMQAKDEKSAESTFNEIKALIIKSADIVDAYSDEIKKKLSGEYVASSDFGTYKQDTEALISANSDNITAYYNNLQEIIPKVKEIEGSILETKAYIQSGELYVGDDGFPVYGIEVGQTNIVGEGEEEKKVFQQFARFTSNRLSFYDNNGSEVAYISDYKLYITHVEISGSLTLGGFVKNVLSDGGVVAKWSRTGGE